MRNAHLGPVFKSNAVTKMMNKKLKSFCMKCAYMRCKVSEFTKANRCNCILLQIWCPYKTGKWFAIFSFLISRETMKYSKKSKRKKQKENFHVMIHGYNSRGDQPDLENIYLPSLKG